MEVAFFRPWWGVKAARMASQQQKLPLPGMFDRVETENQLRCCRFIGLFLLGFAPATL
jgi:hypothetical protein